MDKNKLIKNIFSQKEKLIKKIPNLEHYFIDIYVSELNSTIPFLTIRCFRDFDLHTSYSSEHEGNYKIFLSSGSTGNKRSRHIFSKEALKKYNTHTCNGFSDFLKKQNLNLNIPIISFVPHSTIWPTSSLAAMIEMFSEQKFNVKWCDIESKKENLIDLLKSFSDNESILLFGTTFHHMMLIDEISSDFKNEIQKQFKRLNISIVDTGGTKGRTQAYTLEETTKLFQEFYCSPQFSFYSEYGMCELSSQAWSSQKIHDGNFICNNSLLPVNVSLEKRISLTNQETGFIAFIDSVNEESWGTIITEDIGIKTGENSFYLKGRGPDASIKGCSLNVRSFFSFSNDLDEKILVKDNIHTHANEIISLPLLLKILKEEKKWDHFALSDLEAIAISLDKGIPTQALFEGKDLLIIAAANTPIAWLFPYLIAATSKVKSVTIKVPSLRLDDYFASGVIQQTRDLIEVVSRFFPQTKTYICSRNSLTQTFDQYNIVLTYGTDETLETISSQILDKNKTTFIGKGDIKNSLIISAHAHSPKEIAKLCSLWNGRGCLTPVALFCQGEQEDTTKWAKEFAIYFEDEFKQRLSPYETALIKHFTHSHNTAYIRGQVKQMGLDNSSCIIRGDYTCTVNLTHSSKENLSQLMPEFNFGGAGFIYLFPYFYKDNFNNTLKELPILPSIKEV
jgi:hypothetical protein